MSPAKTITYRQGTAGEHPATSAQATIAISAARVSIWLWSATVGVLGLGLLREIYVNSNGPQTLTHTFTILSLDGEMTVPAWYSSILMWTGAGLLVVHAIISDKAARGSTLYWWALALVFVYLSLDETVELHEIIGNLAMGSFEPGGIFKYRWVIVAAPVLAVGALAFLPFLLRLPRATAVRIMLAGFVFVGGAYGLELVGGYLADHAYTTAYAIETIFEEGMEMAGLSLFITALIDHFARVAPVFTVRVE